MYDKKTFLMLSLLLAFFVQPLLAEESTTSKAESMATAPTGQAADLSTIKRGRLTEEQAISQLKYMMVEGWERMEDELLERGSFKAFGLTLSPDGEFKPLYIDS